MSVRFWAVLVIFIAWSSISWKWYTCDIQGFCTNDALAESEDAQSMEVAPPPLWTAPVVVKKVAPEVKENTHSKYLSEHLPFNFTFIYNKTISYYRQKEKSELLTLCQHLSESPNQLVLTGHTDTMGEKGKVLLGLQRAETVKNHLIDCGCPPEKIQVLSKGSTEPIAGSATVNQRAKNRRVEISMSNH